MSAGIHHLAALRGDSAKPLVLQPQALIDRGLAVLGCRHLLLTFDKPLAVGLMCIALGPGFLLFGGKLMMKRRLLLVSLLLLQPRPLMLKLELLLRVTLLVLKLVNLRLVVLDASVFQSFALSFLLFQKLLLMLSPCRLLLLKHLLLLQVLLLFLRFLLLLLSLLLLLEVLLL